jgi:hypothetical protein
MTGRGLRAPAPAGRDMEQHGCVQRHAPGAWRLHGGTCCLPACVPACRPACLPAYIQPALESRLTRSLHHMCRTGPDAVSHACPARPAGTQHRTRL